MPAGKQGTPDLERSLVLNQWLFGLFGLESTDGHVTREGMRVPLLEAFKLKFGIDENSPEGLDDEGCHRFFRAIAQVLEDEPATITADELLGYDQNIVRHTSALNEPRVLRREPPIVWKYFQYLALLFTEIYLDRYFRDAPGLAAAINAQIRRYNANNAGGPGGPGLPLLDEGDAAGNGLGKLSVWCATGSGKTLLMHANVLQYKHYAARYERRGDVGRVILLTPNEGLSRQHEAEFALSGLAAEQFSKDGRGLFAGAAIEIIDIHKLAEETGDKTVAIDAFEDRNLVLVDEGHRGASSGELGTWMARRDQLAQRGFSFEYSATFKQAVRNDAGLTSRYARNIVFDYSYKYFHGDGYGKNYRILNLDDATQRSQLSTYLTACLLTAYQQLRLFDDLGDQARPFSIARPLWVFVGSSVNAVRSESRRQVSDVTEILLFLATFIADKAGSVAAIDSVLSRGLLTADGRNLFANRFAYLAELDLPPEQMFADICSRLFNGPAGGRLHVELLKRVDGELALRVGENPAFGVINVGDARKLLELCDTHPELTCYESEFARSLFGDINKTGSTVTMLIGSRKFSEGWNSWRVSTLGLMKIGQTEGASIIQLFGRGVRLMGVEMSLKRTSAVSLPAGLPVPRHLALLETLNVFGVRADYMTQFREYLEEEGLPLRTEREEIRIPVVRNPVTERLKVIRLKPVINQVTIAVGRAFTELGPLPVLGLPGPGDDWLLKNKVLLNWYPRLQAIEARQLTDGTGEQPAGLQAGRLQPRHVALLPVDDLTAELIRFKNERGWYELQVTRAAVRDLLLSAEWYDLRIPGELLATDSMAKRPLWHEIAETLLKRYCERFYRFRRKSWEEPHLEYADLARDDPNFPDPGTEPGEADGVYHVLVEQSQTQLIAQIRAVARRLAGGAAGPWKLGGFEAIRFREHLYEPLIAAQGAAVTVRPVPLNPGEMQFVKDLVEHVRGNAGAFESTPLYLLRNMSRGRGVGFFEAGNFHPDFILWRVAGGSQQITFVDPKGVRNVAWDDPRVRFSETVKEIERRLGGGITLRSFIVCGTPRAQMEHMWQRSAQEMLDRNIVFQEDEGYIGQILSGP